MKKLIFLLVVGAFLVRVFFVFQDAVSFHFDMSRDAYQAMDIWQNKDLKLLGPSTTMPGLHSGVLYYYLLSLPYGLGEGDPRVAAIFLSLMNSLAVIPIFLLAKDLFKKQSWAIVASLLYIFSFEAIQYGPWLSNPGPAMFTVSMFFYSLRVWQKGKSFGLLLAAIFASLSTQMEFFLVFLFILIPIFQYLFKIKTDIKQIALAVVSSILILATFIISMIKFNTFTQVGLGLFTIAQNTEINFRIRFTDLLLNYLDRFSNLFINNFFPLNVLVGGLLGFVVLVFLIRKGSDRFILFCLLSFLPIFAFGGQNSNYTTVGMVIPAILGVTALLNYIYKKNKGLVISFIVIMIVSNLYMSLKLGFIGQVLLVIPQDMNLKNQLQLIDQTYKLANNQPFSINTLTVPLWTNTTWAYLYEWYGKSKYGYVPSYYGHNQIGLLGENSLPFMEKPLNKTFFIIEPHVGIPEDRFNLEIGSEDSKTELIEEFQYGELKLQFRKPKINE